MHYSISSIRLLLTTALASIPLLAGSAFAAADLIVINADIRTVDPASPHVEAFAVEHGKFTAIGSDADIRKQADGKTVVIDAQGKTVLPGLIDGHTHLCEEKNVDRLHGVDLSLIQDKKDWLALIKAADKRLPKGAWLLGGGWDETLSHSALPTKKELDEAAPGRPIFLRHFEQPYVWVSSKVLELAGVTAKTKAEADEIMLDPQTGEPSGILVDQAADLVSKVIPVRSTQERRAELEGMIAKANSLGITGVHEMGPLGALEDYATLAEGGKLTLRMWFGQDRGPMLSTDPAALIKTIEAAVPVRDAIEKRMAATKREDKEGPVLRFGYMKQRMDRVLLSYSAALIDDYSDRPGFRGELRKSEATLTAAIAVANRNGFPVAVHAIGDNAVRSTLDAFAAAKALLGKGAPYPNRIEHIETIQPDDIQRFADLGVVASMQPDHAPTSLSYITERVGPEREKTAWAWATFLKHGIPVVIGTDNPSSPLSPFFQFADALFRESLFGLKGGKPWHPEQAVTFDQALFAYSQAGANMTPWTKEIGSISVGKWADFVILDRTLPEPVDRSIRNQKVEATYLAGKQVYPKP